MKTKSIPIIIATVALSLASTSFADKPGTTKTGQKNKAKAVVLVKSTDIHTTFDKAKQAFQRGDRKTSAASITKAANLVSQQQAAALKAHAAPLGKAASELHALAKSVGVDEVKDVKTLDLTFARTHQTLAEYYQGKAQRAHNADDKNAAARAMEAAANHVENGAKWAGMKLSDSGKDTVGLLRKVSGGILSGTGTGVEKVGDVLGKGTKTITNIGAKIRGEGAASDANVAKKAAKSAQRAAGGAVETTGKVTEKATGTVSGTGKGIKKLGEAVKGKKSPKEPKKEEKKDQ